MFQRRSRDGKGPSRVLEYPYLPQATALDPAEEPPSSIDPLGTLGPAERISEVFLPGFTARMWRPRFLTFCGLAALVAHHVEASSPDSQDSYLEARLAFERLFVSALVRQQRSDPDEWASAVRGLPGSLLARRALSSGDGRLSRNNFLKGQASNGPFGVIARLGRHLGILNEDDHLAYKGEELLLAWSTDEGLSELLTEGLTGSPQCQWLKRFVEATQKHIREDWWPSVGWSGWQDLAAKLRPDRIRRREREVLLRLLFDHPIRKRFLQLLARPEAVSAYKSAFNMGRGVVERHVLCYGIAPQVRGSKQEEDRVIHLNIRLANAYERIAGLLEHAFNGIRFALTRRNGYATLDELQAHPSLQPLLRSVGSQLPKVAHRLRELIQEISTVPQIADLNPIEPLEELASEALKASEGPDCLIRTLMTRHRRVQNEKGKGPWIDCLESTKKYVLLPGFGLDVDKAPPVTDGYLHPFRVQNAYRFLSDLRKVRLKAPDEEA